VILSGAGAGFCSGLDVKSMMKNRSSMVRLLWKWLPCRPNLAQRVSVGWRRLGVPVIAAIHGRCWGGGLQIALGADYRFAHPAASLSVMEGKWGLIPDMGGTLALREITNRDHAMRLAMTAEELTAATALKMGLVSELADDPLQAAASLPEQLLGRSPHAIAGVKRLHRKSWSGCEGLALARETGYQLKILAGKNQSIAVRRQRGDKISYR